MVSSMSVIVNASETVVLMFQASKRVRWCLLYLLLKLWHSCFRQEG